MSDSCAHIKHLLDAFLDDELGESKREYLQQHLRSCVSCRQVLDDLQKQGELLRGHVEKAAEQIDFSGFEDRVLAQIRQQPSLGFAERSGAWLREAVYYYRAVWITSLVTAVLLAAVLVPFLAREIGSVPDPQAPVGVEEKRVIVDSMEYAGQRSMIFTVSKNNTTVIWLYDFDRAEKKDSPGDEI